MSLRIVKDFIRCESCFCIFHSLPCKSGQSALSSPDRFYCVLCTAWFTQRFSHYKLIFRRWLKLFGCQPWLSLFQLGAFAFIQAASQKRIGRVTETTSSPKVNAAFQCYPERETESIWLRMSRFTSLSSLFPFWPSIVREFYHFDSPPMASLMVYLDTMAFGHA